LQRQYPGLKTIVVTGYEEFRYAKAAVKNRARDYLLKPVSREDLTAALAKVKQELDDERREQSELQTAQWRLSQYYKEMREHWIVRIVKGEAALPQPVLDRARLFGLDALERAPVRFLTAGLRERHGRGGDEERTPDKLRLPFEMICREFAETHPAGPLAFRDDGYPGLMHWVAPDRGEAAAAEWAEALRACVADQLGFEPVVGIGRPAAGFQAWKEGYLSSLLAWHLLESEAARGAPGGPSDGAPVLTEDAAKVIRRCLARGEWDAFAQAVQGELRRAFRESRVHAVKMLFQLYFLLDAAAEASGVPLDSGEQLWVRPDMALGLDTAEKAAAFLLKIGRKICDKAKADAKDPDPSLMQAVLRFIEDNHMEDLNLTALAERFNYNPSYFSELFKAKVGKTFIQHLTEVRMARAVRLLEETRLTLWDIAELTGFSNAGYFSARFKRMYGITPSEYRAGRDPKKL
jgi:two-component system response regulator YesN